VQSLIQVNNEINSSLLKATHQYKKSVTLFTQKKIFNIICQNLVSLSQFPKRGSIVKPMFQRAGSNRIVTRLNQGFILPRCASKCFSNSIRFQGAKIWNKYHTDLNLLCTYYTFKFNLKTVILNQQ